MRERLIEGGVTTDILAVAPGCPLGHDTVARTGLLAGLLTGWLSLDRQEKSVKIQQAGDTSSEQRVVC